MAKTTKHGGATNFVRGSGCLGNNSSQLSKPLEKKQNPSEGLVPLPAQMTQLPSKEIPMEDCSVLSTDFDTNFSF